MPRKTKKQIETEIAQALNTKHCVTFTVPGSNRWVYATADGRGTLDPNGGFDFGSREAAERAIARMTGPSSSIRAKYVTRNKA